MSEFISSIRSKLDPHELAYLKESFGVELRNPETVAVLAEMSAAAREFEKIEQRLRIKAVSGEPPHCSFCGQSSHVIGPMAQATKRALICRACAIQCIAIIDAEAKNA
jgi:hypothetical protein